MAVYEFAILDCSAGRKVAPLQSGLPEWGRSMCADSPKQPDTPDKAACSTCSNQLVPNGNFCAFCGTAITGSNPAIDRYLTARIETEMAARLKEQAGIVREVADSAEDIVVKRFRNYGILIVSFIGVLGFFGYKGLSDILYQFKPELEDAEARINKTRLGTQVAEQKILEVNKSVDKLASTAADQARRMTDRSNEINKQLRQIDDSASIERKLSNEYQLKLRDFASKVDQMEGNISSRVENVAKQVTNLTLVQAYPNLGKETYLTLNGAPWAGAKNKKAGDRWIDVVISNSGLASYKPEELEQLSNKLRGSGYAAFIGLLGTQGAMGTNDALMFEAQKPTVYFFDDKLRPFAEAVAAISESVMHAHFDVARAPSPAGSWAEQQKFIYDHSGLDAEIVLTAKANQH